MKKKLALLLTVVMVSAMGLTAAAAGSITTGNVGGNSSSNSGSKSITTDDLTADEKAAQDAADVTVKAVASKDGKTYTPQFLGILSTDLFKTAKLEAIKVFNNNTAQLVKAFDVRTLLVDGIQYSQLADGKFYPWGNNTREALVFPKDGITLGFEVAIPAGKSVAFLHQKHDGTWEKIAATYKDGIVSGTFKELSPIAIVSYDAAAAGTGGTTGKTGENNMAVVFALIAIVSVGGFVFAARKAKRI